MEATITHGVGTRTHARPFDLSWIETDGRVVRCHACGCSQDMARVEASELRPQLKRFVKTHVSCMRRAAPRVS